MKQYEAVIEAMKQNRGYATLGQLYQLVLKIPGCKWGTKTPFASIRRIVQTNPEFFKIRPGLWALASERKRVLAELSFPGNFRSQKSSEFDHTYYQGLAVEIGNLKGFQTYVPQQDKNKPFLQKKLGEVATLHSFYDFTFHELVSRARTVDVTWFNARNFPKSFFEVEYSTDMRNSLQKFLEFQDFRIDFFIIADAVRLRDFDGKVKSSVFTPVRSHIRFIDYDSLSDLHSKLSASLAIERALEV